MDCAPARHGRPQLFQAMRQLLQAFIRASSSPRSLSQALRSTHEQNSKHNSTHISRIVGPASPDHSLSGLASDCLAPPHHLHACSGPYFHQKTASVLPPFLFFTTLPTQQQVVSFLPYSTSNNNQPTIMALLIPASSSAAALAVAAVMPTAQHALRVFSRSSSFMSLTAPRPLASNQQQQQSCQVDSDDSISTAFTWTFAPLARELTRTAGGFEHRARWPLTNGSTLLDMHVNNTNASSSSSFNGLSFSSVYARRYSSLPHTSVDAQPTPTQQQHQDFSSAAGAIELPEQPASAAAAVTTPPAGLMAVWFPKAQPRLKVRGRFGVEGEACT